MSTDARRMASGARSTVGEAGPTGWGAWPPPTPGDRPLSMTSRADSGEHAVMATELEQANRTGQPPVGLCGAVVDPAPLGLTARHVCRPCREAVARRRRGAHPAGHLPAAPWAVLVHWYEALVRLLRGGLAVPTQKALAAGTPAPLALPVAPAPRTPDQAREAGGRHRRD